MQIDVVREDLGMTHDLIRHECEELGGIACTSWSWAI